MHFSQTAYSYLPLFTASCKITPFSFFFQQKLSRWSERVEQTAGSQSSIESVPKVALREKERALVDVAFCYHHTSELSMKQWRLTEK